PATQTATATPTPALSASEVTVAADLPLPAGVALLIGESGYGHGVGGYLQLRRLYRLGNAAAQDEVLLSMKDLGENRLITGLVADQYGALMMSRCEGEHCSYEGNVVDAETAFLRSDDGGVSWHEVYRREGRWWLRSAAFDQWYAVSFEGDGAPVIAVPSGEAVARPGSALDHDAPRSTSGTITWIHAELPMLVDSSGSSRLKSDFTPGFQLQEILWGPNGEDSFVATHREGDRDATYVQFSTKQTRGILRLPGPAELLQWIAPARIVVTADTGPRPGCEAHPGVAPAILDPRAATLAFVAEFFEAGCRGGTQRVLAVQQGVSARVETPGDCLNLREEPSESAAIITCLPHGTLLGFRLGMSPQERWWPVISPLGTPGWVDSGYLVR
ncbi:MAG: SH3 domain-containing protein, partial [Dehalococcoidia bacterium]|nr:SH3 domain-containing protein [Dehalococcoidia bacterium]